MSWNVPSKLVSAVCFAVLGLSAQAQDAASAPSLIQQARKLNAEGKQAEAVALYRQALAASPDSFEANLGAGVALDLEGNYAEARRYFSAAIDKAPPQSRAQALRSMAMSYAFEGKASEAEKFEKQVFDSQIAEKNFIAAAETADELARVYLESGNLDKAYEWYQLGYRTAHRKTDLTPAETDLWELRWEHAQARIEARRGHAEAARKHAAAVKALIDKGSNPDQARFYPYLTGYVAFYTGDYATAIAELRKADQRDPFILSLLGQAYEKTGDTAQAMECYRKIMTINAHNPTNAFARPIARAKLKL